MQRSRLALVAAFAVAIALPLRAADEPAKSPTHPSSCTAKGNAPMKVKLTTSMGPIVIELNKEKAPISTENFIKYVESGHYNGTVFHRVIDGFMIQGGGFTKDMNQKPTQAPIKIESSNGLKNDQYTVAMARTNDPNSATSQFFINVVNNDRLNYQDDMRPGYAVFGKVTAGQETVDKIRKVETKSEGMHQNVPASPVTITKAECAA